MKKLIFITAIMLTLIASGIFANGNGEDGAFAVPVREGFESVTVEDLSYHLQWQVEGDTLNLQIAAPTTGWIAVGFEPTKKMKDANILIGYVSNGTASLRDDFGVAQVSHGPDTENGGSTDFSNLEGDEVDGVTVLSFSIPLDSGDDYDKKLTPGSKIKVIMAYGPNDKDDFGTIHAKRGSIQINL